MVKKIKKLGTTSQKAANNSNTSTFKTTTIDQSTTLIYANTDKILYIDDCVTLQIIKTAKKIKINNIELSEASLVKPISVFSFSDGPKYEIDIFGSRPQLFESSANNIDDYDTYAVIIKVVKYEKSQLLYFQNNTEQKDSITSEVDQQFLQANILNQVAEKITKYTDKHGVREIVINGDKKSGRTLFSNYVTNYIYNEKRSTGIQVFYTNLNLSHSLIGLSEWVSTTQVKDLIFVNAPNRIIDCNSENSQKYYIGDSSPITFFDKYKLKIKELNNYVSSQGNSYLNIINMHGFTKGYGKILQTSVLDLYHDYLKVDILSSGIVSISIVKSQKINKQKSVGIDVKGYFIRNSQISRKNLGNLYHNYLLDSTNIIDIRLDKINVQFLAHSDQALLTRIDNPYHLKLITTGIVASIDIYSKKDLRKTFVGLIININIEGNIMTLNIPGATYDESDTAYVEITYSNQTQYMLNRAFMPIKGDNQELMYNGFKLSGIGSQSVRKKIANLKQNN